MERGERRRRTIFFLSFLKREGEGKRRKKKGRASATITICALERDHRGEPEKGRKRGERGNTIS